MTWIALSDELPEFNVEVLLCVFESGTPPPYCVCASRSKTHGDYYWHVKGVSGWEYENDFGDRDARYWQPLPEMPSK